MPNEKVVVENKTMNEHGKVLAWDLGNGPHGVANIVVERANHEIDIWPVKDCKVASAK